MAGKFVSFEKEFFALSSKRSSLATLKRSLVRTGLDRTPGKKYTIKNELSDICKFTKRNQLCDFEINESTSAPENRACLP